MAKKHEYYLLHDGTVLARVEDQDRGIASVFRDGTWRRADHVAGDVTGMGGDADFDKVSEQHAKKLFPKAFA